MLIPVAELEPVGVGSILVARAALHNISEMECLGVRVGGTCGSVAPATSSLRSSALWTPTAPCQSSPPPAPAAPPTRFAGTEDGTRPLYCNTGLVCGDQHREALAHAVSCAALDIDGLGPERLAWLDAEDLVHKPADLFSLAARDAARPNGIRITDAAGWGAQTPKSSFRPSTNVAAFPSNASSSPSGSRKSATASPATLTHAFGAFDALDCTAQDTAPALEAMARLRAIPKIGHIIARDSSSTARPALR